jgi:hypothetical protein
MTELNVLRASRFFRSPDAMPSDFVQAGSEPFEHVHTRSRSKETNSVSVSASGLRFTLTVSSCSKRFSQSMQRRSHTTSEATLLRMLAAGLAGFNPASPSDNLPISRSSLNPSGISCASDASINWCTRLELSPVAAAIWRVESPARWLETMAQVRSIWALAKSIGAGTQSGQKALYTVYALPKFFGPLHLQQHRERNNKLSRKLDTVA